MGNHVLRCAALAASLALAACESTQGNIALGVVGATVLGGLSPTAEIEQVYYLGAFDPTDQVPPSVYRVRVRGQSSFVSSMKFGSGWVPAPLIDTLSSGFVFNDNGTISLNKDSGVNPANVTTGRRLVQFGPEGFREAPKDHRLVVVMGSDPSAFFEAIDRSLGAVSEVMQDQRNGRLTQELFVAMSGVNAERNGLGELNKNIAADFGQ